MRAALTPVSSLSALAEAGQVSSSQGHWAPAGCCPQGPRPGLELPLPTSALSSCTQTQRAGSPVSCAHQSLAPQGALQGGADPVGEPLPSGASTEKSSPPWKGKGCWGEAAAGLRDSGASKDSCGGLGVRTRRNGTAAGQELSEGMNFYSCAFEKTTDSQTNAKQKCTGRSHAPLTWFPPLVSPCTSLVKHHKQKRDLGTV